jgi:hypothetical protein
MEKCMDTNLKPQSTDKNVITMKPQSDKERKMKNKILTISWVVLFLLAGGLILGGCSISSDVRGMGFLSMFALCFIYIASRSMKNWWAIIPGGIFASLSLVVALVILVPQEDYPVLPHTLHWGVYSWVLFLGLAVTFGVLWLLRKTQPTDWAKYPAGGLAGLAMLSLILGARFQEFWAVSILLVSGVTIILALFTRKHMAASQENETIKENFPKGITHGNQS